MLKGATVAVLVVVGLLVLWAYNSDIQAYFDTHKLDIVAGALVIAVWRILELERSVHRIAGGIDDLRDQIKGLRNG